MNQPGKMLEPISKALSTNATCIITLAIVPGYSAIGSVRDTGPDGRANVLAMAVQGEYVLFKH